MENVLILFGFCWMVAGALIGFLLAKRHETDLGNLTEIAAKGDLAEYHRVSDAYKWNKTVHAHTFLFSVVAICIGLSMARMHYSETASTALALAMMLAPVVWTIGGVRSSRPLMAIGDVTLLISIVMAVAGMASAL